MNTFTLTLIAVAIILIASVIAFLKNNDTDESDE